MTKQSWFLTFSASRSAVVLTAAMLLAVYASASAQQAQVQQIGLLDEGSISLRAHLWEALRLRLRDSAMSKGRTLPLRPEEEMESSNDSQRWLPSWSG